MQELIGYNISQSNNISYISNVFLRQAMWVTLPTKSKGADWVPSYIVCSWYWFEPECDWSKVGEGGYIVFVSDGLWEFVSNQEITSAFTSQFRIEDFETSSS